MRVAPRVSAGLGIGDPGMVWRRRARHVQRDPAGRGQAGRRPVDPGPGRAVPVHQPWIDREARAGRRPGIRGTRGAQRPYRPGPRRGRDRMPRRAIPPRHHHPQVRAVPPACAAGQPCAAGAVTGHGRDCYPARQTRADWAHHASRYQGQVRPEGIPFVVMPLIAPHPRRASGNRRHASQMNVPAERGNPGPVPAAKVQQVIAGPERIAITAGDHPRLLPARHRRRV